MEDLPADFEDHRAAHYAAPCRPLDPTAFIDQLQAEMHAALDAAVPKLAWLQIAEWARTGRSS
jgi:hypothetical protein